MPPFLWFVFSLCSKLQGLCHKSRFSRAGIWGGQGSPMQTECPGLNVRLGVSRFFAGPLLGTESGNKVLAQVTRPGWSVPSHLRSAVAQSLSS